MLAKRTRENKMGQCVKQTHKTASANYQLGKRELQQKQAAVLFWKELKR